MGARNDCIGWLLVALLAPGCAEVTPEDQELAAEELFEERAALADGVEDARPVVLVAGLLQDANTVEPLAKALREGGHDVTVWIPPGMGLGDIHDHAKLLGETVAEVRKRTEAAQVDLVGHSQGGVTGRLYIKTAGDDAHVHTLVSLGSPQQGTDIGAMELLVRQIGARFWAPGAAQLIAGSRFIRELNSGDATPGDVRYVTIGTHLDSVTKPVAAAGIPGAENIVMQEACRFRLVGHFGLFEDAWAQQVVLSVLAGGPARGDCAARPQGGLL